MAADEGAGNRRLSAPPEPPDEDDELYLAVARGRREAIGPLFERHRERSWALALRLTGSPVDAGDLLQETWLRLLEKAAGYQPQGRFPAYLKTVMTRLWLDHQKRRRPVPVDELEVVAEAGERPAPRPDLWQAVCALPEAQRLALSLRVHGGAGYDEIAEALGTTRKGVEMLLRRARQSLAAGLRARPEK